ncbi:MAG: class I SAM-dependent methyltransferase [Thermodesulfobacteriota bacterium]
MDETKIAKIKKAIRTSFQESPAIYQAFEDKHRFFRNLNSKLLAKMAIPTSARVLDIGCGTGASTIHMAQTVANSEVWGLDLSPAMLEAAREAGAQLEQCHFVEGDGARLQDFVRGPFDAIIYSASIFLIPDYAESLKQAKVLLRHGGQVGLTFMNGFYLADDENAFAVAERTAQEGVNLKRPVILADFADEFAAIFSNPRTWYEDLHLPVDVMREFFSVPAMSAGLFPGLPYAERVRKVQRLFDHVPDKGNYFRWNLMVGQVS